MDLHLHLPYPPVKIIYMTTHEKILVLDDEPDIGKMIKLILEYKNYSVTAVQNVNMFNAERTAGNFNLFIIDMLLSGADGKDICKAIKQHSETKDIPVIMISAHPDAKQLCLSSGADDFISKPFDIQELISKVNRLMSRKPKAGDL